MILRSKGRYEEAGVRADVDFKPEEYSQVVEAIQTAKVGEKRKRVSTTNKEKKPADPLVKALREAVSKKWSIAAAEEKADTLKRDLANFVDDIPAIAAKGYPKQMIDFLEQKVAEYRTVTGLT